MILSRNDVLSVISIEKGFEIIKNHERTDGALLVKWKGSTFYITFNNKVVKKLNSDNEDDVIYSSVACDFTVTFATKLNVSNVEAFSKYKIINYANMQSDLGAVYVYREDADLVEIPIRHSVFVKEVGSSQITGAVMKMILTGVVAMSELDKVVSEYNADPDRFLTECGGIRA